MRASDVDRDRTTDRLRTAAGEGRLEPQELESRVEAALSARTYGELAEIVRDLPGRSPAHRSGRRGHAPKRYEAGAFVAISALLVAIWALTGAGYFWPAWPMLGWGVPLLLAGTGLPPGRAGRGATLRPGCRPSSSGRAF